MYRIFSKSFFLVIACSLWAMLIMPTAQADTDVALSWNEMGYLFNKSSTISQFSINPTDAGSSTIGPVNIEPLVAKVYFEDQADLNRLAGTLDVWTVNHAEKYFVALLHPTEQLTLREAGYRVVEDVVRTRRMRNPARASSSQTTGIPGYACYRTVDETYADMAQLAVANPTLVSWVDIGDSWEKMTPGGSAGYDMRALVLTNREIQAEKPKLLFLAEVHAREFTTSEIAVRFGEYLVANYGVDPDITWLLDYAEIHLIPMGNPDGRKEAEKVVMWRKNTNSISGCTDSSPHISYYGVDLNRNSSFKWNACDGVGCSSDHVCSDTYRGPIPASEPETKAIQNYTTSIFPDQRGPNDTDPVSLDATGVFLTVHSFSELILFPWGWTPGQAPNNAGLETLGRKFGYFTDYEVCQAGEAGCIYATDGTNDDWAYGELGLAAYTFELGTEFFEACSVFENTIIPDNFPAFLYAFKAAHRPYQAPSGPELTQVTVSQATVTAGTQVALLATADDTRYDSNGWGNEPTQPIAAARYTIGRPSWIPETDSHAMRAADGIFDTSIESVRAEIDTTGWAVGRHMLLVESQDADGNWGVPSAVFLEIEELTVALEATAAIDQQTIHPGQSRDYIISLTNQGSVTDTVNITFTNEAGVEDAWSVAIPGAIGPLAPSASATFIMRVQVPKRITAGATQTVTVVMTSQNNDAVRQTVQLTAEASEHIGYLPVIMLQSP